LRDEATLAQLVGRVYTNLTPASRKVAEAALLRANPHLPREAPWRPGVVVSLPEVPGLGFRPAAGRNPIDDYRETLAAAVLDYREQLARGLEAEERDIEAQTAMLKEAGRTIKATEGAAQVAEALTASLRERRKLIGEEQKRQQGVFERIAKDLESLA